MRAIVTLVTLAALATAAAQESRFNQVKQSKSTVTTYSQVTYTPPMMILGKTDGTIVRCPVATPADCELFHACNSSVAATSVHGEFLFVALESGLVLRCEWRRPHSCAALHQAGAAAVGLALAAGSLHVALRNGTVLQCHLATPHTCRTFATFHHNIHSLAAIGSVVYVGSASGRIDSCSTASETNCSLFCESSAASEIVGMAGIGDKIIGIRRGGFISDVVTSRKCDGIPISGSGYSSVAVYNRKLYMIKNPGEIRVYDPVLSRPSSMKLSQYAEHNDTRSISFSYGTYAIQNRYRRESEKCIWKGAFKCPPTVFHYEVQDRSALEVTARGGRLYDSQGELVDTSHADELHSQKAAIFVMGPDGQILLSNYHKAGLLHTSSLLAGNPVSGAGLMVVHQGKIRNVTACSRHYRPDRELNAQLIESLYQNGYTDPIESYDCQYESTDLLCGQDNIVENTV